MLDFLLSVAILLILSIVAVGLSKFFNSPTQRGKQGERAVNRRIGNTIENEKYVIRDLILTEDGKSSQIDHIVINPRGIFVIETKNYSGVIYGSEMDSSFQIRQNKKQDI